MDEPAQFPGGNDSMRYFISTHINYPASAVKNKLQGKSFIRLLISDLGVIEKVEVIKGVPNCPECDEESIRVIKMMPNWIPGKLNGKNVNSRFVFPITFTL